MYRLAASTSKLHHPSGHPGQRWLSTETPDSITPTENAQAKVIEVARAKVEIYRLALSQGGGEMSVEEQKSRSKDLKDLGPLAGAWESYQNLRKAILDIQPHLSDPDPTLRDMFTVESNSLRAELDDLLANLLPRLVLPPLSTDPLPVLMSINSGAGGAEAAHFCEDLVRMYVRFAEKRRWKVEVISQITGGQGSRGGGGIREMTMRFESGAGASFDGASEGEVYGSIKWERGVHRVQRVPLTDPQSRIHTSTVTVVVLPIHPDTPDEPLYDPKDVTQEVMRSRGAGGQHVNRTESAVRLVHAPTGISVSMQDSRSQHQNRALAWDILRARLSERKYDEEVESKRLARRSQVSGADRSDKIRTYNFPQNRLTDHRIGFTVNGLQAVMEGDDFELVIGALKRDLDARRLESLLLGDEDIDY